MVTGAPASPSGSRPSDQAQLHGPDAPRFDPSRIRPEVLAFAILMERKLRENDHKGGWKQDDPIDLVHRVEEETGELRRAVDDLQVIEWADATVAARNIGWSRLNPVTQERQVGVGYTPLTGEERRQKLVEIALEAADVANMAMMVADVSGLASAIEARSDATGTGAAEGESAAPSGETPND